MVKYGFAREVRWIADVSSVGPSSEQTRQRSKGQLYR